MHHSATQKISRKRFYHPATLIRRLYDWVIHWAETTHAKLALFLIALAEASFFPIPPDVLLIAMGVTTPKRSLRFATICLLGSIIGGIIGYGIGLGMWNLLNQFFFTYIPGFSPELFKQVATLYHENAFWAIFTAGFTPIPFKIFTIAAGATEVNLLTFITASILSRGLRFFLIGGLLRFFGKPVKEFIEKYFDILSITFTILLISGFLLFKYLI